MAQPFEKRELEITVLKIFHESGDKAEKSGKFTLQITVYNNRYCKLEKKQETLWYTDEGEERISHKVKGLSLNDFEILVKNQNEIRKIMGQYERSFQDPMFKD